MDTSTFIGAGALLFLAGYLLGRVIETGAMERQWLLGHMAGYTKALRDAQHPDGAPAGGHDG